VGVYAVLLRGRSKVWATRAVGSRANGERLLGVRSRSWAAGDRSPGTTKKKFGHAPTSRVNTVSGVGEHLESREGPVAKMQPRTAFGGGSLANTQKENGDSCSYSNTFSD